MRTSHAGVSARDLYLRIGHIIITAVAVEHNSTCAHNDSRITHFACKIGITCGDNLNVGRTTQVEFTATHHDTCAAKSHNLGIVANRELSLLRVIHATGHITRSLYTANQHAWILLATLNVNGCTAQFLIGGICSIASNHCVVQGFEHHSVDASFNNDFGAISLWRGANLLCFDIATLNGNL